MKEAGGYFQLELNKGGYHYHDTPYVTKSGRASLHHILAHTKPALVYIPFYTCDTLLEPFKSANIEYRFYSIDSSLDPDPSIELKPGEYLLYINYFGLKGNTVAALSGKYADRLIVDCTRAFFMKGNGRSWFFNACRKFFGVPDGSYLYAPAGVNMILPDERNENYVTEHLLKRFNGHTLEGYPFFVQNELLAGKGVSRISLLSEYLLSGIDYDEVIKQRLANYNYLHTKFGSNNRLQFTPAGNEVSMSYPLLLDKVINKADMATTGLFIPTFWNDTNNRGIDGFEFEKSITGHLCPIPIDHRYTTADMEAIYNSFIRFIQ